VACQHAAAELAVSRPITQYIARLVEATHTESRLVSGVSSRGALALLRASQAHAFLSRQPAVYPDNVKSLAAHVFSHRLNLRGRRNSDEGVHEVVRELLDAVPVP
jgi:MoxR-like ATPase